MVDWRVFYVEVPFVVTRGLVVGDLQGDVFRRVLKEKPVPAEHGLADLEVVADVEEGPRQARKIKQQQREQRAITLQKAMRGQMVREHTMALWGVLDLQARPLVEARAGRRGPPAARPPSSRGVSEGSRRLERPEAACASAASTPRKPKGRR